MMDPYMTKTQTPLSQGRARLDGLSVTMRAAAPTFSTLVRRRRLMNLEARYAEVSRRFELLRIAGTEGVADLKVGLEKAWHALQSEMGWTSRPPPIPPSGSSAFRTQSLPGSGF